MRPRRTTCDRRLATTDHPIERPGLGSRARHVVPADLLARAEMAASTAPTSTSFSKKTIDRPFPSPVQAGTAWLDLRADRADASFDVQAVVLAQGGPYGVGTALPAIPWVGVA